MNVRGAEAYRRTEALSRSPLELVVMLYDGALRFTAQAREAAARGDIRGRADGVSRTLAIVAELQNTLKVDEGGDVARELDRLYTYVTERLLDATRHKDVNALDEVHKLLSTLRDAWSQIAAGGTVRP
jgi:flagellar protein FliS